jgi:anaerobic magnesium-protoporphyrin IX monomethyl ester cyclase
MSAPKKRLVLVFPPITMPSSPPLGLAMLKAYLGRELPSWEVVLLDLNLWFFRRLVSGMASGQIRLSDDLQRRIGTNAATMQEAAALFSGSAVGQSPHFFGGSPEQYDRAADTFLNLIEVFTSILHDECAEAERGGTMSPLLAEMQAEINARHPDVVGFSVLFSVQAPLVALLGRGQRQQYGRNVLVGGGCLSEEGATHFLSAYPAAADALIVSDGEGPLKAFLEGGNPREIPGIALLVEQAVHYTPAVYDKTLVQHPQPDFTTLDLPAYYTPETVLPLMLARGCYWRKCAFCVHHASFGQLYRPSTVAAAVATVQGFVEQGIRYFSFVDEMIPPVRFLDLAQALQRSHLDIAYYALARPESGFTPAVFKEMAASGCKYLLWGLESGSQRLLDLMGKGTQIEVVSRVLRDAHAAGIANHVFIMCGFPTESAAEWEMTLQFLAEHKEAIQAVHRGVFMLETGSAVWNNPEQFYIDEIRVLRETPLGPRLDFHCTQGMSREETVARFRAALPFLRAFHPYARGLANFRDHALLYYGV